MLVLDILEFIGFIVEFDMLLDIMVEFELFDAAPPHADMTAKLPANVKVIKNVLFISVSQSLIKLKREGRKKLSFHIEPIGTMLTIPEQY